MKGNWRKSEACALGKEYRSTEGQVKDAERCEGRGKARVEKGGKRIKVGGGRACRKNRKDRFIVFISSSKTTNLY